MADKNIGSLPSAPDLYDDSLMVAEQQGEAVKITGRQFRGFAEKGVENYVSAAQNAADQALQAVSQIEGSLGKVQEAVEETEKAKVSAEYFKEGAEAARDSIENMTVSAGNLPPGSDATAVKTAVGGSFNIRFGIPEGKQGETGPEGKQGIQGSIGPEGPRGMNGVAVAADGVYAFNVNEDGDLILSYTGDDAPDFKINADGNLILTIGKESVNARD